MKHKPETECSTAMMIIIMMVLKTRQRYQYHCPYSCSSSSLSYYTSSSSSSYYDFAETVLHNWRKELELQNRSHRPTNRPTDRPAQVGTTSTVINMHFCFICWWFNVAVIITQYCLNHGWCYCILKIYRMMLQLLLVLLQLFITILLQLVEVLLYQSPS